jgi:hypothetical protein
MYQEAGEKSAKICSSYAVFGDDAVLQIAHSERSFDWILRIRQLHCKKRLAVFPSPAGIITYQTLPGWENLFIAGQGEFGK